jgi:hypothetical protein
MDEKQAAALRKPFPAGAIGKLPKPYSKDAPKAHCNECGGYHGMPAVHLDYVGHAATTDRLLQVDPGWNWEPLAVDERGHPAVDGGGNLWIKLTVAGVTRLGVGDGKSAKECIGDAIRNAAMRFGVALDLWAKEDLHAMAEERGQPEPEVEKPATRKMSRKPAEPAPVTDALVSKPQLAKIHAQLTDLGITDRENGLAILTDYAERKEPLESSKALTRAEASRVIKRLDEDITAGIPAWNESEETP